MTAEKSPLVYGRCDSCGITRVRWLTAADDFLCDNCGDPVHKTWHGESAAALAAADKDAGGTPCVDCDGTGHSVYRDGDLCRRCGGTGREGDDEDA